MNLEQPQVNAQSIPPTRPETALYCVLLGRLTQGVTEPLVIVHASAWLIQLLDADVIVTTLEMYFI